jgi:2,3-dihydroxybenzoate decarboxylase
MEKEMAISGIPVIAVEEHYWDAELIAALPPAEGLRTTEFLHRLNDLAEIRLADMDAAGIDIQVLSHGAPSGQGLTDGDAVGLIRRVNDRLSQAVLLNPKRFYAFAALPTHYPEAAADELERCVSELGFKGAMVHGLTNGLFLDEKRFWPIFSRAEKLRVPIYLHPAPPHQLVSATYYGDYATRYPMVMRAA